MAELGKIKLITIGDLERKLGSTRFLRFVEECEQGFKAQVQEIADYVLAHQDISFVFLSGPTSSGKTTFSTLFSRNLTENGKRTHLISMDDYYSTKSPIYDEQGRPDYESIDALDLELLHDDLQSLEKMQTVNIPTFDFKSRSRILEEHKIINPQPGDTYMIEGLHGLSDELRKDLAKERLVGIFIMPYASLLADNRMLDHVDMRILRRLSRDVFHRGATALSTIDFWPMIAKAEKEFVPIYLKSADFYVNSALEYEYSVIVPKAREQLKISINQYMEGELPPSNNVKAGIFYADLNLAIKQAKRLIRVCNKIPRVDPIVVPPDSILQEFV
ncbi:MAG: hypothetical protein GX217_06955 [Clostridiaceae bacterium]|nr:hypothetical protein [Clostridiaceae bacterium]